MRVQFMTPHFKSGTGKQVFPRLSSARTKFIEMSDFASFFFFLNILWQLSGGHHSIIGRKIPLKSGHTS